MTFTTSRQFLVVFGGKKMKADISAVSPQRVKFGFTCEHFTTMHTCNHMVQVNIYSWHTLWHLVSMGLTDAIETQSYCGQ